jgi:hypothetical protein
MPLRLRIMNERRLSPDSIRLARPMREIAPSLHFYVDILGHEHLDGFAGHDG